MSGPMSAFGSYLGRVTGGGETRIAFDADVPCSSGLREAHAVVVVARLCRDDESPWWFVVSVVLVRRGRWREVVGAVDKSLLRTLSRAASLEYAAYVDERRAEARAGRRDQA